MITYLGKFACMVFAYLLQTQFTNTRCMMPLLGILLFYMIIVHHYRKGNLHTGVNRKLQTNCSRECRRGQCNVKMIDVVAIDIKNEDTQFPTYEVVMPMYLLLNPVLLVRVKKKTEEREQQ